METGTTVTKGTMSTDVLDMFPGIEAENVLTKPANIMSNDNNLSFLDNPGAVKLDAATTDETPEAKEAREKKEVEDKEKAGKQAPVDKGAADKILDGLNLSENEEEIQTAATEEEGKKTGRDGFKSYLKTKIEAGDFSAFEDWDEKKETLDAYLDKQPMKALHQMLDANWEAKEKELLEKTPQEFFEALPEELQYAARYVMEGGTDMKNLFAALSRVEQTKALDITTEEGQISTTRAYLQATGFGRGKADVIEKQVEEWKESGKLKEKAEEFKPDLDDMQKEQVEFQVKQQAEWNKQRKVAANTYVSNVHKALEKADINGIKLDKKTQTAIYTGLTQLAYPSAAGKPTNLLGHLLDKIQYVEPNFPLLAEVTYLLSDPEGYRNSVKQIGANTQATETFKKLKTEQQANTGQSASAGGLGEDVDTGSDTGKKKKLSKPANLFAGWTK